MITEETIQRYVNAAARREGARLAGVVRRGVLGDLDNKPGTAAGAFSITDDETDLADGVEVINPPGLSFRPKKGTEAILLALGGNAAVRVAFPFVRGQRLTAGDIDEDEVALYVGNTGQVVHLKKDGSVVVRGKEVGGGDGGSITLKANGDIVAAPSSTGKVLLGDGAATKKLALADEVDARFAEVKAKFDTHVHPGVTVGMGSTGSTATPTGPLPPTGSTNVYGKG